MAIQIGINGFGRIGRVAFRIAIDKPEEFHLCGDQCPQRKFRVYGIYDPI